MTIGELVAAVLERSVDEVTDETTPHNTASWTSMAHIQLVVALEDVYRVSLSTSEIRALTSVAAARRMLAEKGVAVS